MTELNAQVDKAVKDFADAIVEAVVSVAPDIAMVSECETAQDDDGKQHAAICDIQTEYGFVTIFPDFNKQSAKAAILNRGLVRSMEVEGFSDEEINKQVLYSDLMPFNTESIDMLTLVLTEDLDLQHQKNLDDYDESE